MFRKIFTLLLMILASDAFAATSIPLKIKTVLLVVAMDKEALPIIKELKLHPSSVSFSNLPMQAYVGKFQEINVVLLMNGKDPVNQVQNIGPEAATLTTYLGIEHFHPDLIMSVGSAGGMKEHGAQIQDVYVSQKIYFIDRRINGGKNYAAYGLGSYSSAKLPPALIKSEDLKGGIVCTGSSFDNNLTDHEMMLKNNCQAIEMEAAGVAWVSMLMKTPMIAIKGITNYVGGSNDNNEFEKNLPIVTKILADKVTGILAFYSKQSQEIKS